MIPFLSGGSIRSTLFQSDNVSTSYIIDPDLLSALMFVKKLPGEDKVVTFPLTFPNYQVAYGKRGGAYVGISMITYYIGKPSYSGFWGFGPYEKSIFDSLHKLDILQFTQKLSLLNVRYIFRNSDPRVMDKFPGYPYVFPGMTYSNKDQLPIIKDQKAYDSLLVSMPVKKIYEKGYYQIYELIDTAARTLINIPDFIYSNSENAYAGSHKAAYVDPVICAQIECDTQLEDVPSVTFQQQTTSRFDVTVDVKGRKKPFLLVLLNTYQSSWDVHFQGISNSAIKDHVVVNGYANGWIIDPQKIDSRILHGRIQLLSQNYVYIGAIISGLTFIIIIFTSILILIKNHYGKK
jgi:hypothetical protein